MKIWKSIVTLIGLMVAVAMSSCSTVPRQDVVFAREPKRVMPEGESVPILVEIHGNVSVSNYPKDCLARVSFPYKFEDLRQGDVVAIRSDDRAKLGVLRLQTLLGWFSSAGDLVTPDNLVGLAQGGFLEIGATPIPLTEWKDVGGTMRVLVELWGRSMLPAVPEHRTISTATLFVPYEKLQKDWIVMFWNPLINGLTVHRLEAWWARGDQWTTRGDNNLWSRDPYPLVRQNYLGVVHKVVMDVPKS